MLWPLVVLAAAVCAAADIEVLFFQNTLQRADWKEARRFFFCLFFECYSNAAMCFPCSIAIYIYSHCCSLIWVWVKNLGAVVNLKITGKRTFISLDLVINIV